MLTAVAIAATPHVTQRCPPIKRIARADEDAKTDGEAQYREKEKGGHND